MLKIFSKKKRQKGFTLIELMIVIVVIGILAAIAFPQFLLYRQRGYNTKAKAELRGYYIACQTYLDDWPTATDCALATVFTLSSDVTIVPAGFPTLAGTTAYHITGTSTYTISVNGNITP
jgi:type IV pilus assembly protein PilA